MALLPEIPEPITPTYQLEWDKFVAYLGGYAQSALGRGWIAALVPSMNRAWVRRTQLLVAEMRLLVAAGIMPQLRALFDPTDLLAKARIEGVALESAALRAVIALAEIGNASPRRCRHHATATSALRPHGFAGQSPHRRRGPRVCGTPSRHRARRDRKCVSSSLPASCHSYERSSTPRICWPKPASKAWPSSLRNSEPSSRSPRSEMRLLVAAGIMPQLRALFDPTDLLAKARIEGVALESAELRAVIALA